MSKPRTFSKAEILDAAKAAAETGLNVLLHPSGEMRFTHGSNRDNLTNSSASPEDALKGWVNENKVGRRA